MVRSLRFWPSRKWSTLVTAGETLKTRKTFAPKLKIFSETYPLMPFTNVTTAMTAATPIIMPSKVRTERSLLAHRDWSAMRIASRIFIGGQEHVTPRLFDDNSESRRVSIAVFIGRGWRGMGGNCNFSLISALPRNKIRRYISGETNEHSRN